MAISGRNARSSTTFRESAITDRQDHGFHINKREDAMMGGYGMGGGIGMLLGLVILVLLIAVLVKILMK